MQYYVNMHLFSFESITLFFITGILGSMAVLFICMLIPDGIAPLSQTGRRSKHIMVFHYPPIPVIKAVSLIFGIAGLGNIYIAAALCVLVISFVMSVVYEKMLSLIKGAVKEKI